MLDTVRVRVPLTQDQHQCIAKVALASGRPQWALVSLERGDIEFVRHRDVTSANLPSYNRNLNWSLDPKYVEGDTYLCLELSVPKFWQGHNIHLLYNWSAALEELKAILEKSFELCDRKSLSTWREWTVDRLDVCYNWRFPTQRGCHAFLNSLKHLNYPYKRTTIRDTSLTFGEGGNSTYSIKFYEKLPEFQKNDLRKLLRSGASLEYVSHLEQLAEGVLRFEATLRRKYLRRTEVETLGDLEKPSGIIWHWQGDTYEGFSQDTAILLVISHLESTGQLDVDEDIPIGVTLSAPASRYRFNGSDLRYFPGGAFYTEAKSKVLSYAQDLMANFAGSGLVMQTADQVKAKLLESYKPVKASRLTAMWLYIQRFGVQSAKEAFGKNSYYRSRSEILKAGVSLAEPPPNVVAMDRDFLTVFRMQIPSIYVTNKFDDFRDSQNLLNLRPIESKEA